VEAGPWEHFIKVLLHTERQLRAATVNFAFNHETGQCGGMLKAGVISHPYQQ
jgi:hypothetical protein